MKWADYCITKLNKNDKGFIESVLLYEDLGETLSQTPIEQNRSWMVQKTLSGKSFCTIKRNENGSWNKIGYITFNGEIFSWQNIPKNISKRKTFISYYHKEDQHYKDKFKNLFDDLIVHKSVEIGDIDSNNSDEYIKQLIQKDYLADTTLLIVLIGPNTMHRKHVDWEISGALNLKVGDKCSGILGIKLPSHPDYGTGNHHYNLLPQRLSDNLKTNYAIIRDWTDDRVKMQEYIELAFEKRTLNFENRVNSRIQMTYDTNK